MGGDGDDEPRGTQEGWKIANNAKRMNLGGSGAVLFGEMLDGINC